MATPLTAKEIKDTLAALKKTQWSHPQTAAILGMSSSGLSSRVGRLRAMGYEIPTWKAPRKEGSYDPQRFRTEARAKLDKNQRKDLERQLYEAQEKLKIYEYAQEHAKVVRVSPVAKGKKRPAVLVALASDWHIEEEVDPAKINGKNAYNLAIAEHRAQKYFQGLVWKARHHMGSYDIQRILWPLMGDFISGAIHPELVETAAMAPGPAIVHWEGIMRGGIEMVLRELPGVEIDLPCVVGNHERTTDKIRVATRVENSFGYMGYTMLARSFQGEKRVRFHIGAGDHVYAEVWDWNVRITHGDSVRYQGGVGGITIPIRKSVDAWNEAQRADYTVMGHWHTVADMGYAVVNGSLIGYSAYSQWIKARYEAPAQTVFLIDRERGKDYVSPIWVDDSQGRRR